MRNLLERNEVDFIGNGHLLYVFLYFVFGGGYSSIQF